MVARGLNASPGAAVGEAVFSAADAVAANEAGRNCVLVRWETNPDDLAGMIAAEGILTSHGGKTSHAAVIARGMGAPCVCGVEALKIDAEAKEARIAGTDIVIREGDIISIDGTTGIVVLGAVSLVMPEITGDLDSILEWADEFRTLGVRANADNPEDAELSRSFGAAGIGLCRTEHMFLGDRKQIIQTFILNDDEAVREQAVQQLLEVQTNDFYGMFKAMDGLPVIVRLLNPPLHEFLESARALDVEIARLEASGADAAAVAEKRDLMAKIDSFAEQNPMLGMRGCRLGIVYPILPTMQVRAIATACARLKKEGAELRNRRSMIPLVSVVTELAKLRALAEEVIAQVQVEEGVELEIPLAPSSNCPVRPSPPMRLPAWQTSSPSAPTTSPRPPSVSAAMTWRASSCPSTSLSDCCPTTPSPRWMPVWRVWCRWASNWATRAIPTSCAACAASTAATPTPLPPSTASAWITSAARLTVCRWRAWRLPKRRFPRSREEFEASSEQKGLASRGPFCTRRISIRMADAC